MCLNETFKYKYYLLTNMKTINVTFEDEEIEQLQAVKGELSWREFIMQLVTPKTTMSRWENDKQKDKKY